MERKRSTVARVGLSTPPPQARTVSASCKPLHDASPAHFDRAVMRGSRWSLTGADVSGTRDSRASPRCCHFDSAERRDAFASTWAAIVVVPDDRLPGHPGVATEARERHDHSRERKRETRPESSRDLPSHYLVPYRLDTPPPSPVTQRRQRLVSSEVTWPRSPQSQACPDLPALFGTRLQRCRRSRMAPAGPTVTGDGHRARP